MAFSNTGSRRFNRALTAAKGFSQASGAKGSPPYRLGGHALFGQFGQGIHNQGFHRVAVLRPDGAQADGKVRLAQIGLQARARDVVAQTGIHQRLAQGRTGQAGEDMLQHVEHQHFLGIGRFAQQPVYRNVALAGVGFVRLIRLGRIRHLHLAFQSAAFLQGHVGFHFAAFKRFQYGVDLLQAGFFGVVAPEKEPGVGRMIVGAVEAPEFLVAEVRNHRRIAAGIQGIERIGEHGVLRFLQQHGVGRGVHAFHFVEHHALVVPGSAVLLRVHVDVPAFLAQHILVDARKEHGVKVDVDEIVEILQVGAGHRIAGLVRKGKCVEEGLEGAFQQFHKRFLDRIAARTTQHGVFQNMGHSGGIARRRAEADAEGFIFVRIEHRQKFGARPIVFPQADHAPHFGQRFFLNQSKTVCVHASILIVLTGHQTSVGPGLRKSVARRGLSMLSSSVRLVTPTAEGSGA